MYQMLIELTIIVDIPDNLVLFRVFTGIVSVKLPNEVLDCTHTSR